MALLTSGAVVPLALTVIAVSCALLAFSELLREYETFRLRGEVEEAVRHMNKRARSPLQGEVVGVVVQSDKRPSKLCKSVMTPNLLAMGASEVVTVTTNHSGMRDSSPVQRFRDRVTRVIIFGDERFRLRCLGVLARMGMGVSLTAHAKRDAPTAMAVIAGSVTSENLQVLSVGPQGTPAAKESLFLSLEAGPSNRMELTVGREGGEEKEVLSKGSRARKWCAVGSPELGERQLRATVTVEQGGERVARGDWALLDVDGEVVCDGVALSGGALIARPCETELKILQGSDDFTPHPFRLPSKP